jgi:catalase
MVDLLTNVDLALATQVALGIAVPPPAGDGALDGANARLRRAWEQFGVTDVPGETPPLAVASAPELSMAHGPRDSVVSRLVAVLAADGVDGTQLATITAALAAAGAHPELIAPSAIVRLADGTERPADRTLLTAPSVIYDGVFVPGGPSSASGLLADADAVAFVAEAYKHAKTLGASGEGVELLRAALPAARPVARRGATGGDGDGAAALPAADGVVAGRDGDVAGLVQSFITALAQHRHFSREAALSASREGAPRAPQNAAPQNPARTPRRRSSR